tara:strand:+ start:1229 stop:2116 length:888 start_codon:yes stop_codon:yes gene_type:complete
MKFYFFGIAFAISSTLINAQTLTVTNPITGETWMDRNLGANQVANSSTDTEAYGHLFQWGRLADGHELRTSNTTTIVASTSAPGHGDFIIGADDWLSPSIDELWQGTNGTNNPCPYGFRIPTEDEWEAERLSWSSSDASGAFTSVLKLPIPGARSRMTGIIGNVGTFSGYRSSDLNGAESRNLGISMTQAFMGNRARGDGNCVRCISGENQSGLIKYTRDQEIAVYPNPTNDQLWVSRNSNDIIRYEIFKPNGVLVESGHLQSSQHRIDLSRYPAGLYYMAFKEKNFRPLKIIKK